MYEYFLKLCEERGVTPADVSKATGVRESTLSNWKTRGTMISHKTAAILAEYFGVDVAYFFTGNKEDIVSLSENAYKRIALHKEIDIEQMSDILEIIAYLSPDQLDILTDIAKLLFKKNVKKEISVSSQSKETEYYRSNVKGLIAYYKLLKDTNHIRRKQIEEYIDFQQKMADEENELKMQLRTNKG